MTAVVRPFPAPSLPQPLPGAQALRAVAHPLQLALREAVLLAAAELMTRFDQQLDAALQALAAEARNAAETRDAIDLGHSLSASRLALQRGFIEALRRRFDPLAAPGGGMIFDLERLSVLPTEELEENIALLHLSERAELIGGEAGRQLQDNLQRAARTLALPMLADVLAPAALGQCFATAFRRIDLAASERLLALRLVESHALRLWPALVEAALGCLGQQGLDFARCLAETKAEDYLPKLSPATCQMLREAQASLAAPQDAVLAQHLLRLARGPVVALPGYVVLSLAGAWMDVLVADPMLPPVFVPELESLRLPLLKAAIVDSQVLENPSHPIRQDILQLSEAVTFAGIQGVSLTPLREACRLLASRIGVQAAFASDALRMMQPLPRELPQLFTQQLASDTEQRREALLRDVRALVHREIEARTLDLALPAAARAALARGFFPLLCTLFLRHGAASPRARAARSLLERFVDTFTLCCTQDERNAVLQELSNHLAEVGLPSLQIHGVVDQLKGIYGELEEEAAAAVRAGPVSSAQAEREIHAILASLNPVADAALPTAPKPVTRPSSANDSREPLQQLLQPGQWFRVRDYRRGEDRWLALASYLPAQDRVTFRSSNGDAALAMRASQLLEDLKSGIAEPVSTEPETVTALAALRTRAR